MKEMREFKIQITVRHLDYGQMFCAKNLGLGPFKISLSYLRTEQVASFSRSLALPLSVSPVSSLCFSGELRPSFNLSCSRCKKWRIVTMVGKGRKKVEINLIKDPSSRMVCFSKRRKGLFKKAEELSILSGAKIAVLAFSQAGKLYCSDTKTMDSLLCSQVDNLSENSSFAEATAADSLPSLQFGKPLENASDSSFAGAMVEQPFSDDVPTPNSLLCPQLNSSTENEAGDGWNCAFTEAMDGNLYCSNAATLNPQLCPQLDIYTEQEEENCGEFDFAEAGAADSLLWPQFEMPSKNIFDSSFAGAMAGEPFFSDVQTPNSILFPQLNISIENDAADDSWNYAFTEAMDGSFCCSDAATLNPLLCPQFDIPTAQEEDNCWEFDFAEAMAGKEVPFWFDRANVQAMGLEELCRLEKAIWDYGQLQFAKNC